MDSNSGYWIHHSLFSKGKLFDYKFHDFGGIYPYVCAKTEIISVCGIMCILVHIKYQSYHVANPTSNRKIVSTLFPQHKKLFATSTD